MAIQRKASRTGLTAKGAAIVDTLEEVRAALQSGEPLEHRFTVRTVAPCFAAPSYAPADVRRIRESLTMSQPVFAALLGVSEATVRSWEQGQRAPSGMARRFLHEIEADPGHWIRRIAASAQGKS